MSRSRTTLARISSLFAASRSPVYVLDGERCLCYLNPACAQWLGREESELLGQICDYGSSAELTVPSPITTGLCPPPEVLTSANGALIRLSVPLPDQRWSRRMARVSCLDMGEAEPPAVLVVVSNSEAPPDDRASPSIDNQSRGFTAAQLHERLRLDLGREYRLAAMVGGSLAIARARRQAELAASSGGEVLVVGPPGSGREHVCRSIHYARETQKPGGILLPLDGRVITAELLQQEVLALVRRQREHASGARATLLLLEVDQLPRDAQLELGGLLKLPHVELRVLATSSATLIGQSPAVDMKTAFRADLASRLSTLVIEIPPLARRLEDVPLLAQHFLEQHNVGAARQLAGFTAEALERLCSHSWPGEVQELADTVREACRKSAAIHVGLADLPSQFLRSAVAERIGRRETETIVLDQFLAEVEVELLRRALQQARGNKTKAAELLGISRPRLHRRLIQLGLVQPTAGESDDDPPVFEQV